MADPYCFRNWLRQSNDNDVPLDIIDLLGEEAGFTDLWLPVIDSR